MIPEMIIKVELIKGVCLEFKIILGITLYSLRYKRSVDKKKKHFAIIKYTLNCSYILYTKS